MPSNVQAAQTLLDAARPTLCLYHDDPDGCCAAAIVRRMLGSAATLHPLEIGDAIPWEAVETSDQVVLLDYSLPVEDMRRLGAGRRMVWIDHHKTALAGLSEAMADVAGERSVDAAACVLAWRTFYPGHSLPLAVELVGDRDIWQMAHPETRPFCEGLYQEDFQPANDGLWQPLLDDDRTLLRRLVDRGQMLYAARLKSIADVVARCGFAASFDGHRTLAVNHPGNGDMGEYIRRAGYELAYCYVEVVRRGQLQTVVTLYSDQIDVSEIAHRYGGGGHRGAAGFQFLRAGHPFPESAGVSLAPGA